jgi:hypothetical protein
MTRKRIATLVYAVFGVGVGAFVVSNIVQVALINFRPPPPAPLSAACGKAILPLVTALDRAAPTLAGARVAFTAALSPEWDRRDDASKSCTTPEDMEAFSEVLRLERLLESSARTAEADTLRKRLEARIGVEGRK